MFSVPLWIIFAFVAPVLFGVNMIVDKITLSKYIRNAVSYLTFVLLSNIFFLIPAIFLIDISMQPIWIIVSLTTGVVFGLSFLFFTKVLETEEASKVAILTRLMPIFGIPLAALFLQEILNFSKYLGIVLLALGGIVISAKEVDIKRLKFSKGLILISIFNVLAAGVSVVQKHILNHNDFWSAFYWLSAGAFLAGLLLFFFTDSRRFISQLKRAGRAAYILRVLGLGTYYCGSLLMMAAVKEGLVTIVLGASSVQPLVVLMYSTFLTIFFPRILVENLARATILQKIFSIILVVLGSWLVI